MGDKFPTIQRKPKEKWGKEKEALMSPKLGKVSGSKEAENEEMNVLEFWF